MNGSRLLDDRAPVAGSLGFDGVIEHTRDAMWQTDGLVDVLAAAASLCPTQSKLAEDLEIWASSEFDYVDLADGYSRSSVLMPQKRNPYALSIIRGASGVLIGRLTGFLAVIKSPSARSDNLIYAYGEVPRALDLALRTTRLTTGVVRTLQVNAARMWAALECGFCQATDLAEYVMQTCGARLPHGLPGGRRRRARRAPRPGCAASTSTARCSTPRRSSTPAGRSAWPTRTCPRCSTRAPSSPPAPPPAARRPEVVDGDGRRRAERRAARASHDRAARRRRAEASRAAAETRGPAAAAAIGDRQRRARGVR